MVALIAAATAALLATADAATAVAAPSAHHQVAAGEPRPYPGDPVNEAKLVAAENARFIRVRALSDAAARLGVDQDAPYRLAVGTTPTLVLVARPAAYTIDELTSLAPRSVVKEHDGSYLVTENIVVQQGATLRIVSKTGMTVHLSSDADGFVSIVANGGSLAIQGSSQSPVKIDSWDSSTRAEDALTSDGRAYVRVYGGRAQFVNAEFTDLGFWSGLTGGVALTGTKLLDDPTASDPTATAPDATPTTGGEAPSALSGDLLPADGGLTTLSIDGSTDDYGYASGIIQGVTFRGNAFGFFVSSSDRVEIRDSVIEDSLVDGLVLHRDVSNSNVESTIARNNAQNGFRLARATSSVTFQRLQANDNGRDGITLEGGPLADGPSSTGNPTTVYGNNEVTSSTATGNGRYGIEVVGGVNIVIAGNTVARNVMGIVVSGATTGITIKSNEVTDSQKQGIALKDSGLDAKVMDNTVSNTRIGIYVRDAGGDFEGNQISGVSNHGISLLGATGNSTIVNNTISGVGPTAIDVARTSNSAVRNNDIGGWQGTKPLLVVLRSVFQPLTILWVLIAFVVLVSLLFARRRKMILDPFASQAPLSSFTRGIVERDRIGAPPLGDGPEPNEYEREGARHRELANA
jgi:parallel beta-helix repeat protein